MCATPRDGYADGGAGDGVVRLGVRALPDPAERGLALARRHAASGDDSWEEWLVRAERREIVAVSIVTRADFVVAGRAAHAEVVNHGVWLERAQHVPQIEEQLREIAYVDVDLLRDALGAQGLPLGRTDLEDMYVHVALAGELVTALAGMWSAYPASSSPGRAARAPERAPGA